MQTFDKTGDIFLTLKQFNSLKNSNRLVEGTIYHIMDEMNVVYFDANISEENVICTFSQNNDIVALEPGREYIVYINLSYNDILPKGYNFYFKDLNNNTININTPLISDLSNTVTVGDIFGAQKYSNGVYSWSFVISYSENTVSNIKYRNAFIPSNLSRELIYMSGADLYNAVNSAALSSIYPGDHVFCISFYQNQNDNMTLYKNHTYEIGYEGQGLTLTDLDNVVNKGLGASPSYLNFGRESLYCPNSLTQYLDVGDHDQYGKPFIYLSRQGLSDITSTNVYFDLLNSSCLDIGICRNLAKEGISNPPQTYRTNKPSYLYVDTTITPSKQNLSDLSYVEVFEGLESAFLMGIFGSQINYCIIGVARQIYEYDTKPTKEDAISDMCFYYSDQGEIVYVNEDTDYDNVPGPIYTYSYGVAYFPNMDGDFSTMIPLYATNDFYLGEEMMLSPGWQVSPGTSFSLDQSAVEGNWQMLIGSEEGNGTWYYFNPPVEYATKDWVMQQIQSALNN